jgi:hypothetical protein
MVQYVHNIKMVQYVHNIKNTNSSKVCPWLMFNCVISAGTLCPMQTRGKTPQRG